VRSSWKKHAITSRILATFNHSQPRKTQSSGRLLPVVQQPNLIKWLEGVEEAFTGFDSPEVQELYAAYTKADKVLARAEELNMNGSEKYSVFCDYDDARSALLEASPDPYATLFAVRRHQEGGKPLVEMWGKVIGKLKKDVETIAAQ